MFSFYLRERVVYLVEVKQKEFMFVFVYESDNLKYLIILIRVS